MGSLLTGRRQEDVRARALLTLRLLPGVGDRTVRRLTETFGSPERAVAAPRRIFARCTSGAAAAARDRTDTRSRVEALVRRAEALQLTLRVLGTEGYPRALENLFDPPPLLFLKGDLELLERRAVAIVGARRASGYGRRVAAALARDLAAHDVAVVSGMALGVDAAAHEGALSASGGTIAVLGSALDRPYPRSNLPLFRQIAREGLLVSEFLPGEGALPHHFPRRNRIIAGLSSGVIVVEAGRKSGALITVDHALDLGREVFALPGSVENGRSAGSHALIRDGAHLVTDVDEILSQLGWSGPVATGDTIREPPDDLGPDARRVWKAMGEGPAHLDDLLGRSGLTSARGLAAVSMLELSGWATRESGGRFAPRRSTGTFEAPADG